MTDGRRFTLSGSFDREEDARVRAALQRAAFTSVSEGVREVLLAFSDDQETMAAVLKHIMRKRNP